MGAVGSKHHSNHDSHVMWTRPSLKNGPVGVSHAQSRYCTAFSAVDQRSFTTTWCEAGFKGRG